MKRYSLTKCACYFGYIIQAIVNNFVPILYVIFNSEPYNISVEQLGNLALINFSIQIVVDVLAVWIIPLFGYKKSVVVAQALSAVGFILLAFLPSIINPYAGVILSMLFLSLGSGLIEVVVSPIIEAMPNENKSGSMSFLHSFYCIGQVIVITATTFLLIAFGRSNWKLISLMWCIAPIINTILFAKSEIIELKGENEYQGGIAFLKKKSFYPLLLIMLCAGASEIAMVQWSSFFVETGFGISKWLSDLFGPCMFAVFMCIGRILFGIIGDRIKIKRLLFYAAVLCFCCYVTVAFSKSAVISLTACAVCGLSVSVMWPGSLSFAAASHGGGTTGMFGFLAMAGDIGCGIGPWILAIVSSVSDESGFSVIFSNIFGIDISRSGMQLGFLASAIFPFIMIMVALFAVSGNKRYSHI